jgi:ribosomal protein L37AE/L43A
VEKKDSPPTSPNLGIYYAPGRWLNMEEGMLVCAMREPSACPRCEQMAYYMTGLSAWECKECGYGSRTEAEKKKEI